MTEKAFQDSGMVVVSNDTNIQQAKIHLQNMILSMNLLFNHDHINH